MDEFDSINLALACVQIMCSAMLAGTSSAEKEQHLSYAFKDSFNRSRSDEVVRTQHTIPQWWLLSSQHHF